MTSDELDALAAKLKEQRAALGLTLRALSDFLGISYHAISRLERREGEPSRATVQRVKEWLGEGSW